MSVSLSLVSRSSTGGGGTIPQYSKFMHGPIMQYTEAITGDSGLTVTLVSKS